MISIIISPKFNKENLLSINLKHEDDRILQNIKLCFSLVYSIKSLKGAKIIKQVGRYYELELKKSDLLNKEHVINIQLQIPRTGTYNLSCGPEGAFILDDSDNLIPSKLKKLKFDKPIIKKIYKKISNEVINPIIPEPLKSNLSNNFLKKSNKKFFSKDTELKNVFDNFQETSNILGFSFNTNTGN